MKPVNKKKRKPNHPQQQTFLQRKANKPVTPKEKNTFLSRERIAPNAQTNTPILQRKIIRDTQNRPQSIEFTLGAELQVSFVRLAQRLVNAGRLGEAAFLQLREQALKRRGTISDSERLFMAGLLDVSNQTQLLNTAIQKGNTLTFPLTSITGNSLDYLDELSRRSLPIEWEQQRADVESALVEEGDFEKGMELLELSEQQACEAIADHWGGFKEQGEKLLRFAEKHNLSFFEILKAMLAAASDNSSGDKVLAGIVYAVAKQSNNAMCDDLITGKIKVDALIPRALARLPGYRPGMMAAYVPAALEQEGLKGDTLYLPTNLSPENIAHRSAVIHELRHAQSDKAASPTAPPVNTSTSHLEADAYRSQAHYILEQMSGQQQDAREESAREINAEVMSPPLYGALLLEARGNANYVNMLNVLFTAPNTPLPFNTVQNHLQIPNPQLQQHLLTLINQAYQLPPGQTTSIEGLAGESIIDWVYR